MSIQVTVDRSDSSECNQVKVQCKGYNPALDGVRGLAILFVLFHHLWPWEWSTKMSSIITKLSHLSWLGVDLFFVLSGFLITGILLDTRHRAHYFKNFIMRRTLRIFPVYYLFLVICFLFMPLLLGGSEATTGGASPWWYFLYGSNYLWIAEDVSIQAWLGSNASSEFVMPEYLGITWSLAVEEQFYLLWPAVVYVFARRLHLPILVLITSVILVRIFLVITITQWADATYMASICRVDSLLMGAGLAWYARSSHWSPKLWQAIIKVGLFVCLPVVFCYQLVFPGRQDPLFSMLGYSLVGLGFAGMLAYVTQDVNGFGAKLFRGRFLTWMGKYSYGLYLYHMLVWAVSHHLVNAEVAANGAPLHPEKFNPIGGSMLIDAPVRMLLCSLITAVIAWVSYRVFEQHFIKMKKRF